jgi:hypothetical protein
MAKSAIAYIFHVLNSISYNQFYPEFTSQELNHSRSTMDPDEPQKRELDRPGSPTPDPAVPQTEHTEYLHNEASGEDNGTVEPPSSEQNPNEANTPTRATAAQRFIDIAEFRLMLYKNMANSATSSVGEFSGLFLSCKAMYSEAETEIVELRKQYIDAEERKWSEIWGLPVAISKPRCYRDLNTATVTVPMNKHLPGSDTLYNYRGLWGDGARNPPWPLRDLALPRLEIRLHHPHNDPFGIWQQNHEFAHSLWKLLSASQPSPQPGCKSKCVTKNPLRARCMVYSCKTLTQTRLSPAEEFERLRGWNVMKVLEGGPFPLGMIVTRTFEWTDQEIQASS